MTEQEIVELLKKEKEEFRRLYQEHKELDNKLTELSKKPYLTTDEEVEEKKIKKEKLYKKDRIAEWIRQYKKTALTEK